MSETHYETIGGQRGLRPRLYALLRRLVGRSAAFYTFRHLDMVAFAMQGVPPYAVGSIDITYRCNLKCKHCYFLEQGFDSELSDDQWIARMDYWRDHTDFPFYQCSWVGGEPLLRKQLIERLMPRFKANLVVTNGSIPLPDWRDCNFYVSVDGTRGYYASIRGNAQLYDRIKANVNSSEHLKITAAMTVNRENWQCIPELLEEWASTHVKGFVFQFFTPVEGVDESMWTGWKLRDHIIDMLITLRHKYGDFIINTVPELRLMKSHTAPQITRDCRYARMAFCLGPDGKVKLPCMMGEKADCTRCGCILPFFTWLLEHQNVVIREVVRSIRKFFYRRSLPRQRLAALHRQQAGT